MPSIPREKNGQKCTLLIIYLVEGEDIEPGSLVARGVEGDPHGVLLEEGGEPLVDGEVLVRFDVEQLHHVPVLDRRAHALPVLRLVLFLLHLGRVLEMGTVFII